MLTVAEAAALVGVSSSTLRRLSDRGEFTILRPSPRVLRVEEMEVERYKAKLRGEACPSTQKKDAIPSSFNSAESAYIAAAHAARQGRKRKRSKRNSGTKYLQLVTSG